MLSIQLLFNNFGRCMPNAHVLRTIVLVFMQTNAGHIKLQDRQDFSQQLPHLSHS